MFLNHVFGRRTLNQTQVSLAPTPGAGPTTAQMGRGAMVQVGGSF